MSRGTIWTLIGALGVSSTLEAGAGLGGSVVLVYAILTATVFALSLTPRYGKPGSITATDWSLAGISIVTLMVWQVSDLPTAAATSVAVAADAFVAWPTLREAWRQPKHEAPAPWVAGLAASILGLIAITDRTYSSTAYPIYLAALQGTVASIVLTRHRINRRPGDR